MSGAMSRVKMQASVETVCTRAQPRTWIEAPKEEVIRQWTCRMRDLDLHTMGSATLKQVVSRILGQDDVAVTRANSVSEVGRSSYSCYSKYRWRFLGGMGASGLGPGNESGKSLGQFVLHAHVEANG